MLLGLLEHSTTHLTLILGSLASLVLAGPVERALKLVQKCLITESENVINRQILVMLTQVVNADDGNKQTFQEFGQLSLSHDRVAHAAFCEQWRPGWNWHRGCT